MEKFPLENDLVARGLSAYAPYLMNRITHRYNQTLGTTMAEAGLSTIKMRVVCALAAKGSLTVNDLSVYAVAEQSTMSRTLEQMAREGLVDRAMDESDSRVRVISLTQAGHDIYTRIWPAMAEAEARMFDGIDPADRAQLLETLDGMLRNIRLNPL
ncbi:MarR family winged helix-turn-helix transcriptional regulator [Sulfitobacter sp. HNIBRBA3233]|uniref:MarR family winged helix-turn-helix transcriptional regulator n=1 Tax=Sulfitobacter marinivivus TaxID=3158558 RepID=UPI0032DECE30